MRRKITLRMFTNACVVSCLSFVLFECQTSIEPESRNNIPVDRYVFIEQSVLDSGALVKGVWPFMNIDFPTYTFDDRSGVLIAEGMNFPLKEKYFAVWGASYALAGCLGDGIGSGITGVSALPYQRNPSAPTLTTIAHDGTVALQFPDTTVVLAPGGECTFITTSTRTIDTSSAMVRTTLHLINHGCRWKSKIQQW
jgi:hypothetical protein